MITHCGTSDTGLPAAVCEYLPDGSALLCGTYQLRTENAHGDTALRSSSTSSRIGSLLNISDSGADLCVSSASLYDIPGVLDAKPCEKMVALALADGSVRVMKFLGEKDGSVQVPEELFNISVTSGLCLAEAWCPEDPPGRRLAVTDSFGGLSVINLDHCRATVGFYRKMHVYEAWSVCWDSGGDDSLLILTDLRQEFPVSTVRGHDAGVTSIVPFSVGGLLLTGSYDEKLRAWDKRNFKRPVAEVALGGGVWKIKPKPLNEKLLACACMQGGARLVTFDSLCFHIIQDFMRDRKLVYGIDWRPVDVNSQPGKSSQNFRLAACSFYDHVLDIFSFSWEQ